MKQETFGMPPMTAGPTRESIAEIETRVAKKRRLRLMLHHIDGAACLLPLVADLDSFQLDAMLNLVSSTETLESL
jgi:hypothetical protein